MDILLKTEWTYTEGPQVIFDCPHCQALGVSANTQGTVERTRLYGIIPVFKSRYTDLTCNGCGKSFRLAKPLEVVAALPPEAISRGVRERVPPLIKFCIICGIALSVIPFLGLPFSVIGLIATVKKPTKWRIGSIIGLALSLIFAVVLVIVIISGTRHPPATQAPGPRRGFPTQFAAPGGAAAVRPTSGEVGGGNFAAGDKVEVNLGGQWRAATVVESRGMVVFVRFDDPKMPPRLPLPPDQVRAKK